jgi:peptidoglycan hydrolase CwlO-like protein
MLEETVMSGNTNDKISELILASLTQLTVKVDDITTKLAKMEAVIENSEKSHLNLEAKLEREVKDLEDKMSSHSKRISELEAYKANMQARIVVIGSVITFAFTLVWGFLNKYVFPTILS